MIREELLHAIDIRHSCRNFSMRRIDAASVGEIQKKTEEINSISRLSLDFLEDGSAAFSSVLKTYGMFRNVRSLILVKGERTLMNFLRKQDISVKNLCLNSP